MGNPSAHTTVATMCPDGEGPSEEFKGTRSVKKLERKGQYVNRDPMKYATVHFKMSRCSGDSVGRLLVIRSAKLGGFSTKLKRAVVNR